MDNKIRQFLNSIIDGTEELIRIGSLNSIYETGLYWFELLLEFLLELIWRNVEGIFLDDSETNFTIYKILKGVILNLFPQIQGLFELFVKVFSIKWFFWSLIWWIKLLIYVISL